MIREVMYGAVLGDALDSLGHTHHSPRVQLAPQTGQPKLVAD